MGSKGQKVAPLQTALDGRPRAGANCGENGIGNSGREIAVSTAGARV